MNKNELTSKIYSRIDELPTLPTVLPEIMRQVEDERSSTTDVADVLSRDPALTSKLLKVANSAYYGYQREIGSLNQAVPLLGLNIVKSLALSVGIMEQLPRARSSSGFSPEGLWTHSLAVASAMQDESGRVPGLRDREHLFVVGLLHDIGKIVLHYFFDEIYSVVLEEARQCDEVSLYAVERDKIGLDHGEVGSILLQRWQLPEAITQPIARHHSEDSVDLDVALLRVADFVARASELGESGNPCPPEIDASDLDALGLAAEELSAMKERLTNKREKIEAFFKSMTRG